MYGGATGGDLITAILGGALDEHLSRREQRRLAQQQQAESQQKYGQQVGLLQEQDRLARAREADKPVAPVVDPIEAKRREKELELEFLRKELEMKREFGIGE